MEVLDVPTSVAQSEPVDLKIRSQPIAVVSHPRSGTHLIIDGLRHFFIETWQRQRFNQAVHDLYVNLDRLHPQHPYRLEEERVRRQLERSSKRLILKTHCSVRLEQVGEAHRPFVRQLLDASRIIYVVRDVRPVMASYLALRPLRDPASPRDIATFLRSNLDAAGPPAENWAAHVNCWLDRGVRVVRFEEVMDHYEKTILALGEELGLTRNVAPIRIFRKPRTSLENRIRRLLGMQNSSAIDNRRMALATRDWRTIMSPSDLALIRQQAGAAMERLGYSWDRSGT